MKSYFFQRKTWLTFLSLFFLFFLASSYKVFSENLPFGKEKREKEQSEKEGSLRIEKNWLLGRLDYKKDKRFIRVAKPYTKREKLYLHRETYAAFRRLYLAARKKNIHLEILSGARSFKEQKRIWERKWKRIRSRGKGRTEEKGSLLYAKEILRYSSMPGSSRHHWGTDLDLNSLKNSYFQKGKGKEEYEWLKRNAPNFGFCQVYTKKSDKRPYGYNEESWHWSYLPLALPLSRAYAKRIRYNDMKGFLGAKLAKKLKIIERYVKGIDPACKSL